MNTPHLAQLSFINNHGEDSRNLNRATCFVDVVIIMISGIVVMEIITNTNIAIDRTDESLYILATKPRLGQDVGGIRTNYAGRMAGLGQCVL